MTFPDQSYDDIAAFRDDYAIRLKQALDSVDRDALRAAADRLDATYRARKTLYVSGNGGSAAIANSFVCDHVKLVATDTEVRPRVVSLSANIPMVTAISNDLSYADVFLYQLQMAAEAGDTLLTISASGDSENVVRAAAWARDNGLGVVAFTGFAGGRTAALADVHLHVKADNYGVIEDAHQSLMHLLAQYLRLRHMDAGLIPDRKF